MVTLLPKRYRPFTLVLAAALVAGVDAVPAHAESLSAGFAASPGGSEDGYRAGASPVVYRAVHGPGATSESDAEMAVDPRTTAQLLAVVLAVPAGTQADSGSSSSASNLSSVVKSPGDSGSGSNANGQPNASDPGSASVSPEPASLGLALVGSALAGLMHWRRRRRP